MTLKSKSLAVLVVVLLFGGIFFSTALGWWQTESTRQAATYKSGEFAGEADPADIRGSYTFGDVEANFAVPAEILAMAFGVETDDPGSYPVKSLEEMYLDSPQEVGTASVRLFVAFYLGLPFDLSTDIYLPESAVVLLSARSLTTEQTAYLETHTVSNLAAEPETVDLPVEAQPVPTVEETHIESTERMVKGKTTFADLLEWGVSKESIEQVLGLPLPAAPGMLVRDFCSENGLSFETIKTELQALVDQVE